MDGSLGGFGDDIPVVCSIRAIVAHRRGEGRVGRRSARRHGRSLEPCTHRESSLGGHRRYGTYRIVDLPSGSYTVTFSLTGFNSSSATDIQLTTSFTATVDAALRWAVVEETITVTGESPIVDVQGSKVQKTLDSATIGAIPNARQYFSFTALVPGLTIQGSDVGGSLGPTFSVFQAHGGRRNEGRLQIDGAEVAFLGVSYYVADTGAAQEISVAVTGGMGEAATGGPVMNVISRSGGNTFSGSLFGNFANSSMTSTNVTQDLLNAGLKVPNALEKNWDTSAWYGGPVKKIVLWFFVNGRHQGNRNLVSGVWRNLNAGDSTRWTYQPDLSQQAKSDGTWKNAGLRLTVQATARNKFVAWWDEQSVCRLCLPLASTPTTAPEATNQAGAHPERAARLTWTSPVTNRLLLEANIREHAEQYGGREKEQPRPDPNQRTGRLDSRPHLSVAELESPVRPHHRSIGVAQLHYRRPQPENRFHVYGVLPTRRK